MTNPLPSEMQTLVRVPSAFQANAIVAMLNDQGIAAIAVEETFMAALAPSASQTLVCVQESDLTRAQFALNEARRTARDIDWDQVDVGDDESNASHYHRMTRSTPPLVIAVCILGFVLVTLGLIGFVLALVIPTP